MSNLRKIAGLGLAAAIIGAALLTMSGGQTARAAGTTVGFDVDTTGNGATSLSTIERCRSVSNGQQFNVDVFVDEIPAGSDLAGFNYNLGFDSSRVRIVSRQHDLLLVSSGTNSLVDLSEGVPDTVSPHSVGVADFGTAEAGPVVGVLARYTIEVLPAAPAGIVNLILADVALSDSQGGALALTSVLDGNAIPAHGVLAVGQACPPDGADLALTKTDTADPVAAGGPIGYVITVNNNGPFASNGVVLTDVLPSQVIYSFASPSQGSCSHSSGTVTCNLGTILSAGSASVTIGGTVNSGTSGSISNSASVTATTFDQNPGNNSGIENTFVGAVADLSIAKTDSADPVLTGSNFSYNLLVFNAGPSPATSVSVSDTLPSQVTYLSAVPSQGSCSFSLGTVTCSLGALTSGANASVQVNVNVSTPLTEVITNTATVSSPVQDPTPANNSDTENTFARNTPILTVVGVDANADTGTPSTATSLGAIETCRTVTRGQNFSIDVFLNELPTGREMGGFSYILNFDDTRVRMLDQNHNYMIASAPGSAAFDISEAVPDNTAPHDVGSADFGTSEVGPLQGVLGRYTFTVPATAPNGLFNLAISSVAIADPDAVEIPVDQLQVATISIGQACPADADGDGVPDASDNCPTVFNPGQGNQDGDSLGDACDADMDGDGVPNGTDNCNSAVNPGQQDFNADGAGDACDDTDGDGIVDANDNCIFVINVSQANLDGDALGDACDSDRDGDTKPNVVDNCPDVANPGQEDFNNDGSGDVCDDSDSDGIYDVNDNCVTIANPGQEDQDLDDEGDACDTDIDGDTVANASDVCLLVREDLDAIDDSDGCPDVDSGLVVARDDPVSVGINVTNQFSVTSTVANGNVMANGSLVLILQSTVGACEARWTAQVGDTYSETTFGGGPVILTSTLTVPVPSLAAFEQRAVARTYDIICAGPGVFSIDFAGQFGPTAPTLEELGGPLPNSDADTITFTAFQASDIEIVSLTGPDDLPISGNQLLVGAAAPEPVTISHTVRNNGPFTPTDIIQSTSVADVDANSDSSVDCSVAPNQAATTLTLPLNTNTPGSTPFSVEWQDASPPPASCSLRFWHATQVTTPTARDLNATEVLLDETTSGVELLTTGTATAAWTGADASVGSNSVQFSFGAGAGNVAEARVAAGIPFSSILDLRFDYKHVSGAVLPSTDVLVPGVSIGVDCDGDAIADETILSSQLINGDGEAVAGEPGWFRADVTDSSLDSWYVPGIVPSGSPVTLAAAISAISGANAACTNTDTLTSISLQYGDSTATAGVARVDNLFFSGAERALFAIDLVLDSDGDGIANNYQSIQDNCPNDPNAGQQDTDNDGQGDICDSDLDGDGVPNGTDNCPSTSNPSQADFDSDTIGDACDDSDADGVFDATDNCRTIPNPAQTNTDGDTQGDACDPDDDNDGIADGSDACSLVAEDVDGTADTDGCPDTDVSVVLTAQQVTQIDVGATGTFAADSAVTNGNRATNIAFTLSVRTTIGQCEAHLIPQLGDTLTETNIDTNFDTVPDSLNSVLTATLSSVAPAGVVNVDRDYTLVCQQRGSRSLRIDVSANPIAPVVEEDPPDNSFTEVQNFSVYDVSDVNAVSMTAPDALPTRPGTQILVGPLPPVSAAAPVGFSVTQTVQNLGPFGPVSVNSPTTVNDVDQDGDTSPDCDFAPNVSSSSPSIAASGTFVGVTPINVTWLDGSAPPTFCTANFQKTLSIATAFVRDPNALNNSTVLTVDFVRDTDADGVPDNYQTIVDNCPITSNVNQADADGDLIGNVCDPDIDGDGIANGSDNCPTVSNPGQQDADADNVGDACDNDLDNDGIPNAVDNCPNASNPLQQDIDGDLIGDACDDSDGDGVLDTVDNCIAVANPSQSDIDGDSLGDACDSDRDGDGVVNSLDNCGSVPNPSQANADGDAQGDACDTDDDNDGILDGPDGCDFVPEDPDGSSDSDGCPDSNASVAVTGDLAPVVDINVPETFPLNTTVTNGNVASTVTATITLVSDPQVCDVHLIALAGDVLNEFSEDTDFNTVPDRFTSRIQRVLNMPASGVTALPRDYLVTCSINAAHTLNLTSAIVLSPPVVDENPANNTFSSVLPLQAWGVANMSLSALSVPDDWPAVPANGGAEPICNDYFDDDGDTVINDGCPGIPGAQVLVQSGAPPHVKYPSGVAPATRNFSGTQTTLNSGPFSPANAGITYTIADVDGGGSAAIDCDSQPNSQVTNVSLPSSITTPLMPTIQTNWPTTTTPPFICSASLQSTLAITSPFVRDSSSGNDSSNFSFQFVRDADGDGVPDDHGGIVDNCPTVPNADQVSTITPGIGDACDPDFDFDGVDDNIDNCVGLFNPNQRDTDNDGLGDPCDPDMDADGVLNGSDNCPLNANVNQTNTDGDAVGNLCDPDDDNDRHADNSETIWGSNSLSAASRPEACDTIDNDGDGSIDESYDRNANTIADCVDAAADTDGDGTPNPSDPDDDNDAYSDTHEAFAATDSLAACTKQFTPDVWPPDANRDLQVTLADVVAFAASFNAAAANSPMYVNRMDHNGDNVVGLSDVVALGSVFNSHC